MACTSGSLMVWNQSALCKDNCVLLSLAAAGQEEEKVLLLSSLTDHNEG